VDIIDRKIVTDRTKLKVPLNSVSLDEEDWEKIGQEMLRKMELEGGIGLAANQIGIDERICIVRVKQPIFLVNPTVVEVSDEWVFYFEGCLSFPNTKGNPKKTKRFKKVKVIADNHDHTLEFFPDYDEWPSEDYYWGDRGLLECVAIQHELAHLNGQTLYDYLANPPRKKEMSFGRNEKVMFMNKGTGATKYMKYKKGLKLLNQGWEVV